MIFRYFLTHGSVWRLGSAQVWVIFHDSGFGILADRAHCAVFHREPLEAINFSVFEEKLLDLHKKDPNAQILLRGDQAASHGRVIQLLSVVKSIGFKRVDLVVSSPKAPEP